jgi:type IV pilus assembly protein PilX
MRDPRVSCRIRALTPHDRGPVNRGQRGVVLFVVMLVLVVMALAAAALVRSVDISTLAAGNLSFKRSVQSATDVGVEASVAKFRTGSTLAFGPATESDLAAEAYFATIQATDSRGVPTALLNLSTFDAAHSANCFWATPGWATSRTACTSAEPASAMGQVRYLIDRQCTVAGPYNEETCNTTGVDGGSLPGGSQNTVQTGVESTPVFRVTVRVVGPKNTVSFSQVVFRP